MQNYYILNLKLIQDILYESKAVNEVDQEILTKDGECGGGLRVALGVLRNARDFSHVALGGRVDLQDHRPVGLHDLLVVRPVDVERLAILQPERSEGSEETSLCKYPSNYSM